jgi:hypothetical protein
LANNNKLNDHRVGPGSPSGGISQAHHVNSKQNLGLIDKRNFENINQHSTTYGKGMGNHQSEKNFNNNFINEKKSNQELLKMHSSKNFDMIGSAAKDFEKNKDPNHLCYYTVENNHQGHKDFGNLHTNLGHKENSNSKTKLSQKLLKQPKIKPQIVNNSNRGSQSPKYKKLGIFNNLKINTKIKDANINIGQLNSLSKSPISNSNLTSGLVTGTNNYNINFHNGPNVMNYLNNVNTVKTQNIVHQFSNKTNSPIKL